MPRLSKIRLTGCKYDGLTKEHENSIFDLEKDQKAVHSLFTLGNGGGKGFMMQMIFQLLLPETKWGKSNGNKIISMFYDQRDRLHPFTFHVALEWILDTIPEKRLITGIAVKAIIKNTSIEDDEKTGLSYFLYTHEHDNTGYYKIENLPLYDDKIGQAEDLDRVESFINNNKRDFTKYSQSSAKRSDSEYYRFLENRGIYRNEWTNLKTINKSEGGSGDYFIRARDNKSIFDRVIIPAISEHLSNYTKDEESSLIEMFKSNLSITKDLPILIKREASYHDLLGEIKPLIENAQSGSGFFQIKNRLINEGNDIYFILNQEESLVIAEIDKWENERQRAKEERERLEFEKANLYYNKDQMDLEKAEKERLKLEELFQEILKEIEKNQEELLLYKINEKLYEKKRTKEEISSKTLEKKSLIKTLDISDIESQVESVNQAIDLEWDKTKDCWTTIEHQYRGYISYANGKLEENKSTKKKYLDKVAGLQNEINKFELKQEELAEQRNKLQQYYDFMRLEFPENIAEDLIKLKQKIQGEITLLVSKIEVSKKQLETIKSEITRLGYTVEKDQEETTKLKERIKKQEEYEKNVARNVTKQLLESYDGSLLDHSWFAKKQNELGILEGTKGNALEATQRTIWEKNIDRLLNKEDYFIPNKDIIAVKNQIQKIGIHVETGTQYLQGLEEEEKSKFIDDYPGFIYSVVIANKGDWETIDKNIDKNLFLNNMVPIFIRGEMETSHVKSFKMLGSKANKLLYQPNYISWKDTITGEVEDLIKTETNLKEDLQAIGESQQELNFILKNDTAFILNQKLKKLQQTLLGTKDQLRIQEEQKLSMMGKLGMEEANLEDKNNQLGKTESSIIQIETYIEKIKVIKEEEKSILEIKKDVTEIKEKILEIEVNNEGIENAQNTIKDSYNKWSVEIKSIIQSLQSVVEKANYLYQEDKNYKNSNIPDFSLKTDQLLSLINEKKSLNQNMAEKNSKIALLDQAIVYLNKNLRRHQDELQGLSSDWSSYPYLELARDEIVIMIKRFNDKITDFQKIKDKTNSELKTTEGSIRVMEKTLEEKSKQILKDHQKAPILLKLKDVKGHINLIERDIVSNKDFLHLCNETLEKNKGHQTELKINLSKIKNGYSLELTKGKLDPMIKEKAKTNPDLLVEEWLRKCENNKKQINKTLDEGERFRRKFIKEIDLKLDEDKLKNQIIEVIKQVNIMNFKNNLDSFQSMENHFQQELLKLSQDKRKAEDAMKQWTNRSAIHIMRMVEALKSMVASMNYMNDQGYAFPLVKLKGAERLPKEESEIIYLLEEYFIQAIKKAIESNEDVTNIDDKLLQELMGDEVIFSKALQGRYPTLLVYKMSEKNEFRYARAREEHYTTWEAINKGEGISPEGSGGQTLSVNTFVIMMIMSFKKKHIGNENPSTVLILDNPFGQASAKYMLDPIFEIADKLNFQLICFAAPEIIKVEISERFPVFWELRVENGKIVHGGRIMGHYENKKKEMIENEGF